MPLKASNIATWTIAAWRAWSAPGVAAVWIDRSSTPFQYKTSSSPTARTAGAPIANERVSSRTPVVFRIHTPRRQQG
jgi:hypothetical protein